MTIHTQLPIYKVAYDLLDAISDLTAQFPRNFRASMGEQIRVECVHIMTLVARANIAREDLFATANSYFGLLRQSTHGHHDRANLAKLLRLRGMAVNRPLTKGYRA